MISKPLPGGSASSQGGPEIHHTESAPFLTLPFSPEPAFDPDSLLNPGKAIPTLHRCAELGAMHVHGGKLPFPELERF